MTFGIPGEADAEILKANVIFRAVAVPPGRHVVRFSFHPIAGVLAELAAKLSMRTDDPAAP
ncbi:MAG: YfhO family protein [Alphaproteobacteria bacterium]|nr:MAG: YfhO family protein [Alphaproteobacteria bacterium]